MPIWILSYLPTKEELKFVYDKHLFHRFCVCLMHGELNAAGFNSICHRL